ncbi:ABC-2 type transport system ATP-binding protein [Caminicella sporogenes DSM 14501]|uniref:ABC-2 type transport system ATP-binding protein n=1 Tax=Caminicella sporogenes DSM 14501 TaxID=1121266 RepID=A0A1M6Q8B7_9FIRM|nr:ABC transporter ATP-binding protein [Caminicella sporogenes]RKD23617.1 sodium ABC transporter ATP-binding protein [Caminicella sporogenes]SHK16519.1 ABC-2 type transport system ATP-binding protein [Caminicella sporogenes DSM 14501]
MGHILELKNVRKEYKDFTLKDISFTLDRGYIMGYIGPNGAGKSTTIKLIMNLLKKDDGEIRIFGLDNIKHEREIKQRIGFIYDQNHFYDELTLKQMKKIISNFYSNWDDNLYREYIKRFNLREDKKIKELSKGMQMKFSLVLALSHNAELIIMDEPTSGLDPVFRSELLDILMDIIQDENKAIFFSTHITTDLEKVADYITFINDGKLVFSKAKDEILDEYGIVKGSKDILTEELKENFIGIRDNKFGFEALTAKADKLKRIYKDNLIIERASLDDIMLFTIRGNDKNV